MSTVHTQLRLSGAQMLCSPSATLIVYVLMGLRRCSPCECPDNSLEGHAYFR